MKRIAAGLVALAVAIASASRAATIHVPADQPTIQAGIMAATSGDTVLVSPGTYFENIDFLGKAVSVISQSGPESTIIDGQSLASVVSFVSGEGLDSVLQGFTIRNGGTGPNPINPLPGGGVRMEFSSASIIGNIISNNFACGGCGILVHFGSPLIQSNIITHNGLAQNCTRGDGGGIYSGGDGGGETLILDNVIANNVAATGFGGGIFIQSSGSIRIQGNIIRRNSIFGGFPCSIGGGMSVGGRTAAEIVQNLIVENSAGCVGGVYVSAPLDSLGTRLVNNTIANNDSAVASGFGADGYDTSVELINNIVVAKVGQIAVACESFPSDTNRPSFKFNNVYSPCGPAYYGVCGEQTGLNGNISVDPLFVCPSRGDYRLQANSPGIDAGSNSVAGLPSVDFDGNLRILDGNNDAQAVVDMGAYESAVPNTDPPCLFISCPQDMTLPAAQGTNFAIVNYPAPVAPPDAVVECSPLSGAGFPVGLTTVYCVVSNGAGVTCCQFDVTVFDNQLPSIKCSGNIITNVGELAANAVVTFAAPLTHDNSGIASVNCTPPSGSTFPLGTNGVTCTAVDTSGNTNTCMFNVVVQQTPTETQDLALLSIKPPKRIGLSDKKPSQTKAVKVRIQNLSQNDEMIENIDELVDLVALTIQSLGTCPVPVTQIVVPKKGFPILLAPKKKFTVKYNVTFDCANDRYKGDGHEDFIYIAYVDRAVLDGNADTNPSNDDCPRAATGSDKGCAPVTTDVFLR